ncbi:MAG: zinc ABC transporter substrate-binding protein [Candidatus Delongbacteria bacterium]|nr:zinc ABC transporter substrate-binding protein [Candidatus Delongbacteria bacterium]
MNKTITILILIMLIAGCSKKSVNDKKILTVSILPQKFFVEKIVGDKFNVNVLLPPGVSPHTFEPSPSSLIELSKSDIYFIIGDLDFEKTWLEKFQSVNPKLIIKNTSEGVDFITHEEHEDEDEENGGHEESGHSENDSEKHHHSGIDPHIWMSPKEVKVLCKNILNGMIEIDNENKEFYQKNFESFENDLEKLDMQIRTILDKLENREFIIYHPALGYFARDYDLEEISIEIDGKEPSPEALKNIIDTAKENEIRTIFIQKQFDIRLAESIAGEINGKVMQLDPLSGDWINNMILIARTFQFEVK